jgi:hypothetical protein
MQEITGKIRDFFAQYEARVNRALEETPDFDAKGTAEAFSDFFIAANPNGVACGKNDEKFQLQILHGYEFYRSIGTKSMKISRLTTTSLDEFHVQTKVRWQSNYEKRDGKGEKIDFDVIYLLQIIGEKPKIFAYITGDEERDLRERGLI